MTDTMPPLPDTPPLPAPPPAPPRRNLSATAAGLLGLAAGAGLMGAVWGITATTGTGPGTFTLEGAFALTEDASDNGSGCAGTGGYDDIAEGTSVTVYGADGDVIATGHLGDSDSPGHGRAALEGDASNRHGRGLCVMYPSIRTSARSGLGGTPPRVVRSLRG
ncbi:hypothetical protein [Streptomyces hokutonensis]|uniref:hypothetical protein n=1 Tax=Streptomyces hokutonensis TaxID=1306990 RepID=UPI00157ACD70|nr:hypothetical protein [Streptomyces hokutonensis]